MPFTNHRQGHGLVAILIHWIMAVLIPGLFLLGTYMVDLDYYHPWYLKAPDLHRSLGVVVALLLIIRLFWRILNEQPTPIGKPWERLVALWVHRLFYLLIAAVVASGYLISTAKGQPIDLFGWLELPALFPAMANQEDVAGQAHGVLATLLILLALLHTSAALKHHFVDRDGTLLRILLPRADRSEKNYPDKSED